MSFTLDIARPGKSIQMLARPEGPGPAAQTRICVVNNGDGPHVLVVAGIHGDEFEAQLALQRLIDETEAGAVRGRLVIIPQANFPAAVAGARVAPSDGLNMNRTFPGDADGSETQRLAAFLFGEALAGADLLIDVHSGGPTYKGEAIGFYFHSPACSVPAGRLAAAMEAFGLPYITHQDGIDTTFVGAAAKAGIAAIELEGGGTTLLERDVAETLLRAAQRGLHGFGVLREAPAAGRACVSRHLDVLPANMFEAPAAGLLEHCVKIGDAVAVGDLVARLYPLDALGGPPVPVTAKAAGIVISQRSLLAVRPGDALGNTGTLRAAT